MPTTRQTYWTWQNTKPYCRRRVMRTDLKHNYFATSPNKASPFALSIQGLEACNTPLLDWSYSTLTSPQVIWMNSEWNWRLIITTSNDQKCVYTFYKVNVRWGPQLMQTLSLLLANENTRNENIEVKNVERVERRHVVSHHINLLSLDIPR